MSQTQRYDSQLTPRDQEERRRRIAKSVLPGMVGAVAAGAVIGTLISGGAKEASKPEPTGIITVEPGQTFSGIAQKVAVNTPQHETMQQAAESLRDTNHLGRYPDVAAGQQLEVPTNADANPKEPGIQLDPPAK